MLQGDTDDPVHLITEHVSFTDSDLSMLMLPCTRRKFRVTSEISLQFELPLERFDFRGLGEYSGRHLIPRYSWVGFEALSYYWDQII
jgi:hypothetical protein